MERFYIDDVWGFLAMVLSTICYRFSAQISKKHLQQVSVYYISLIALSVGVIVCGAFVFTKALDWSKTIEPQVFWSLIGLGVFGSGFVLFFFMVQKGSAEFATMVTYLIPPVAIVIGYLFLHEEISLNLVFGLLLIFSGVYILGYKKKDKKVKSTVSS